MDRLEYMLKIQYDFQNRVNNSLHLTPEQTTKEYILCVNSELIELLGELNWKTHRVENKQFIRTNVLEELIDAQKYLMAIAAVWDFSPEEYYSEFQRKSDVVEQRWIQEKQLENLSGDKIVGIDIDGVLADYYSHFIDYLNCKLSTAYNISDLKCPNVKDSFHINGIDYEHIKDAYRQNGEYKNIAAVNGAKELLDAFKTAGYQIALLTSRPYIVYKRLFADTIEWLNKNSIKYDIILFDENKNAVLYRNFGDRVKFFIEDELEKANNIASMGVKTYLLDRCYNQGAIRENVFRIKSLLDIKDF